MKAWERIGEAQVPGGTTKMVLFRRGDDLSIQVGGLELMNTRAHGSEDALADLACDLVAARPGCSVLVGGLGMGFTLAAALRRLGPDAKVVVAELVPEVVDWNRGPVGPAAGHPLDDPRVTVLVRDVGVVIRHARAAYDAILLDVDNGPEGMTREANDVLYDGDGLHFARDALRPGGVLAIWSAEKDDGFVRFLKQHGFTVDERKVGAGGHGKGRRHVIWLARPR